MTTATRMVWRARLRAEGRCLDCREVVPSVRGFWPRCDACRTTHNAAMRQLYRERLEHGHCGHCGGPPPVAGSTRCEPCLRRNRVYVARSSAS